MLTPSVFGGATGPVSLWSSLSDQWADVPWVPACIHVFVGEAPPPNDVHEERPSDHPPTPPSSNTTYVDGTAMTSLGTGQV